MGEECGCSRGHARENGACPKLQARSARKQEGLFCISAEMRTSTDFPPYISSISIFWHFRPRTSILVVVTFFSGCDCFYGGVVLTTSTAQYRYRFTYLLSISKKVVSAGISEILFFIFIFYLERNFLQPTFPALTMKFTSPSQRANLNPCGVIRGKIIEKVEELTG